MVSENPFADFRKECECCLTTALQTEFPSIFGSSEQNARAKVALSMEKPPNPQFGQLASSLCFQLAKIVDQKPILIARRLVQAVTISEPSLVERVEVAAAGYINFHLNFSRFSELTLASVHKLGSDYGFIKSEVLKKTMVEHTSVNPLHPIHIGQARNPLLGDALARLLKKKRALCYRSLLH